MVRPLAAERLIVKTAVPASVTVTSSIVMLGAGSSSVIVPMPCESRTDATPVTFVRLTLNVSGVVPSYFASAPTVIVTDFDVSPGAYVSVVAVTAV